VLLIEAAIVAIWIGKQLGRQHTRVPQTQVSSFVHHQNLGLVLNLDVLCISISKISGGTGVRERLLDGPGTVAGLGWKRNLSFRSWIVAGRGIRGVTKPTSRDEHHIEGAMVPANQVVEGLWGLLRSD